jgi:[acyl-carrier-protein] S-malonyltransferase
MVKIGVFHPGQGAQYPGMAMDLYQNHQSVRRIFETASDVFGRDMHALLATGSAEELRQTANTQMAVLLAARSARLVLEEAGCDCVLQAGFSLGELAAMASAGVFDDRQLFCIALERGRLMEQAVAEAEGLYGKTGMAAVLGLSLQTVSSLLERFGLAHVHVANDNSNSQTVIAGPSLALEQAAQLFKEAGARRVVPLKVSGPFHTPLMESAVKPFKAFLASIPFHTPEGTLLSSVSGTRVDTGEQAKELLAAQLVTSVNWRAVMVETARLASVLEIGALVESGPGTVLTGLWATMDNGVSCLPGGTDEQLGAVAALGGVS